eukprot:XP_016657450.1 PREDICTED: uncharacterized protein LOC107882881 [Acyrthosiphon pisum]
MDSSLNIELNRVMQIVLEAIRINRSTTMDILLDALKLNYPNVNTIHLRYKLNKVIRELKTENVVHEIKKKKIDFGQNVHCWTQNIGLIDLSMIQCLKVLDQLLSEILEATDVRSPGGGVIHFIRLYIWLICVS